MEEAPLGGRLQAWSVILSLGCSDQWLVIEISFQ
jgi:hypothetical protein